MSTLQEFKRLYRNLTPKIVRRINEFEDLWKTKSNDKLFAELCFCLLTPQSKAKNCWAAVLKLREQDLLFDGNFKDIRKILIRVRFRNNKTRYIIKARKHFQEAKLVLGKNRDINELRNWLVNNICGFGYKEASHFLRNIGLGEDIAILDRHVLKNLKLLGIIDSVPGALSKSGYLEIEARMRNFAKKVEIPMSHLDLLMWYKETGGIFK